MQLEKDIVNDTTKVAIHHVEAIALEKEQVYFAITHDSKSL